MLPAFCRNLGWRLVFFFRFLNQGAFGTFSRLMVFFYNFPDNINFLDAEAMELREWEIFENLFWARE